MELTLVAPAAVLVLWSLIVLFWLAAARLPALNAAGVDLSSNYGGRGVDLEGVLPDKINWKAHNFTHLMEQPTIFYATVCFLTLAGATSSVNVGLAWAYVGLRVIHSMVQCTYNRVSVRFTLFLLSTLCLLVLAVNALLAAF